MLQNVKDMMTKINDTTFSYKLVINIFVRLSLTKLRLLLYSNLVDDLNFWKHRIIQIKNLFFLIMNKEQKVWLILE